MFSLDFLIQETKNFFKWNFRFIPIFALVSLVPTELLGTNFILFYFSIMCMLRASCLPIWFCFIVKSLAQGWSHRLFYYYRQYCCYYC